MKFKKSLVAIVSSLLLSGSSNYVVRAQEQVNLELLNIKVETRQQLEELVKYYSEQNPNVHINVTTVGGSSDPKAALQAQFASGNEPHIFFSNGLSDTQMWQHTLADLSDLDVVKFAAAGTLDGATVDGKIYGIPNNMEGTTLIINKEIFKKAGINPEEIKSFEDFKKAVETLEAKKSDLGIEAPIAFSGRETQIIGQWATHFFSPEFENSTAKAFNSKKLEYTYGETFKAYADIFKQYAIQPINSVDYSAMIEDYFANEKVAMVSNGNWIVPTLDSINPEFRNKLGILPYFVGGKATVTSSNGWYWTVNSNKSKSEIAEAKKFLNWMYSDEIAKKKLVEEFNYIPAYTNFDKAVVAGMDNVSKSMYEYVQSGNNTVWVDSSFPDGWGSNSLGPNIQKYWDDMIDWEQVMKVTSEDWNRMR
ncbi:carbohydrate ABC transporter substrate-binding protein [Aerococcaceae bacterium zg-BR9]|uniref:ABC transporter substrate-binding protein n=1 Tax=Aerococcaceae bacterium zg-1292 TaxID=2774330 RepID=UPI0040633608|nr:carbohydrate ABC transporter substrate-binding protein [Aerococcaceae bacterium zg-BR9]